MKLLYLFFGLLYFQLSLGFFYSRLSSVFLKFLVRLSDQKDASGAMMLEVQEKYDVLGACRCRTAGYPARVGGVCGKKLLIMLLHVDIERLAAERQEVSPCIEKQSASMVCISRCNGRLPEGRRCICVDASKIDERHPAAGGQEVLRVVVDRMKAS